ncbi:zincin-like metallopeptidase domain-containing protein, partial [Aeromonas salmonicida]|uniref:zincin-like metallopeptidase domain-containing protein n=2 Tax=Aeromonas salmonicida TaxID=645 RepID=UPI002017E7B6
DILKASGAIIRHDQADRAFYRMSTDSIHLPQKEAFPAADRYYATALHELGHWTGHTSRLDRDLAHPFGSEGYAKEELRAEIASMIMGDELGIGRDPSQHVAYVKSWIKALQDDPLEIFRAAADAEKIQGYVLGLEQQRTQEQPVTLAQEQRSKEHAEVMGEIQRLTNPDNVDAETVQLFRDTFNTFERTAQEADYVAYYSWGDSELGDQIIRINYEDSNGNTLPVHTDVVGRGKALTYIGEERVPGTAFSSDNEWQSNALKTAFASMDKNVALAAKNVRDQVESISGDPRELPEDVKFPKNWLPNSSLLESGSTERSNSQTAAGAEMTTQAETVTPEQQRRNRAEKFILSNLDGGLADHVPRMNRSQLALSREVLFDAQSSEPNSDFWQRNGEFLASFSQNWPDAKEKIDAAYKELDFATSLLPAKKYLVADNPGANEKLNFVLETNSAIKALAAVNEGENRAVHDSRILGNNQIDLNDRQGNFYQTLDAEKAAIAQGIMTLDEEMNVLPPQDAQEWYQNSVESILEGAEAPTEAYSAMEALGPEPGELEAVFLSDMGQRVIPEVSLNIAQENTPIKVPYQERNEA